MGALLRAACEDALRAGRFSSYTAIAEAAGLHPQSLTRSLGRADAATPTVRAVCLALQLKVALVAVERVDVG